MQLSETEARSKLDTWCSPSGENRRIAFVFGNGAFFYDIWPRHDVELLAICAHLNVELKQAGTTWLDELNLLKDGESQRLFANLRDREGELLAYRHHIPVHDLSAAVWHIYDSYRVLSGSTVDTRCVPLVYRAAADLASHDLVSGICTTNYDLSLDAILRALTVPIAVNPCAATCGARGGFNEPDDPTKLKVWKPHGRLDFYAAPSTATPATPTQLTSPNRQDPLALPVSMPWHFHDYNEYYRSTHFECEVTQCCQWIESDLGAGDVVVVAGFTGHYDEATKYGEEVAKAVVRAVDENSVKALMLHMWSSNWRSYLWQELKRSSDAVVVDAPSGQTAVDIFDRVVCQCTSLKDYIDLPN